MSLIVVLCLVFSGVKLQGPSEQLHEEMSSWAANFGLSPGEMSEQEYLLALSNQYQVDPYEDNYQLGNTA